MSFNHEQLKRVKLNQINVIYFSFIYRKIKKNHFIPALGEGEAYILDCPFSSLCRQVGFLCFKIYCSTNLLKVQDLMFANMEP